MICILNKLKKEGDIVYIKAQKSILITQDIFVLELQNIIILATISDIICFQIAAFRLWPCSNLYRRFTNSLLRISSFFYLSLTSSTSFRFLNIAMSTAFSVSYSFRQRCYSAISSSYLIRWYGQSLFIEIRYSSTTINGKRTGSHNSFDESCNFFSRVI